MKISYQKHITKLLRSDRSKKKKKHVLKFQNFQPGKYYLFTCLNFEYFCLTTGCVREEFASLQYSCVVEI